jgi:hypothetical protein
MGYRAGYEASMSCSRPVPARTRGKSNLSKANYWSRYTNSELETVGAINRAANGGR